MTEPHRPRLLSLPEAAPADRADPSRDIKVGGLIAFLFFFLFLAWAAIARLDASAFAGGTLTVSGQRQVVQHRDGGVIDEILVKDGERVRKGQVLIQLDAPEAVAAEKALQTQSIQLLAQRARLRAELGASAYVEPVEFGSLDSEDRAEAELAMQAQKRELATRRAVLSAQRGALAQRVGQSGLAGQGYEAQEQSAKEQLRLIDEQLRDLAPLAEEGFVSKSRIRELQRMRADIAGQQGQYSASRAQSVGAASETRIRILEAERSFSERASAELATVETRLADVTSSLRAAEERLARTQIRAPATGDVVGMTVFTPGGVISPGERLMDIVPERQPLRVRAQFSPEDVDDLRVGMTAQLQFPGIKSGNIEPLEGTVTRISADAFTAENGMSYYDGEITVPLAELERVKAGRGADFAFRAGMPVQVTIPVRKRTALQYLFEPLTDNFRTAMHEN